MIIRWRAVPVGIVAQDNVIYFSPWPQGSGGASTAVKAGAIGKRRKRREIVLDNGIRVIARTDAYTIIERQLVEAKEEARQPKATAPSIALPEPPVQDAGPDVVGEVVPLIGRAAVREEVARKAVEPLVRPIPEPPPEVVSRLYADDRERRAREAQEAAARERQEIERRRLAAIQAEDDLIQLLLGSDVVGEKSPGSEEEEALIHMLLVA
jgi:hypothetical protein